MFDSPDEAALAETEQQLREAIIAWLRARLPEPLVDDMTDDAMGAIIEAMHENWGVDLTQGAGGA